MYDSDKKNHSEYEFRFFLRCLYSFAVTGNEDRARATSHVQIIHVCANLTRKKRLFVKNDKTKDLSFELGRLETRIHKKTIV